MEVNMTAREKFLSVFNFEKPKGSFPMIEWAAWWDKTMIQVARRRLTKGYYLGCFSRLF